METATLTSTPPASHDLLKQGRIIGRRKSRAFGHADNRNVSVNGRQIGFGSFWRQSRRRGSRFLIHSKSLAECASPVLPGFAGKSNIKKPHAFLAACSGRDDDFRTNKILFCTRISTGLLKWHRWLQSPPRTMSAARRGGSGDFISDEFGPYPWDSSWNATDNEVEWIQEDIVTLFTTDGLVQIGGSLVPHELSPMERKQARGKSPVRYRRFKEEDYMDPKQGLCLGASFDIVATNGLDMGRRFCVFGFCRSIEMLSDVVEDTVLEHGGEVVVAAKGNWGGLNEKLSMRVAVPLLWGVPPAVDTLNYAIRCGGGIVEKVSCQWEFL